MKALYLPFFIACLVLHSCTGRNIRGHGSHKTESRPLPAAAFDKVSISAPVDAHITLGAAPSLSFEGFANLLPYLRTELRDGTLRIFIDEHTDLHTDQNIIARITLPALTGLDLNGSSDAIVRGAIAAQRFDLHVSGSADVALEELMVGAFHADMSGSSALRLGRGYIREGFFAVSGSGEIRAFGVTQRRTSLELSGSADAEVAVADELAIDISGAGNVSYKGHPRIRQEVSGSGTIREVK